MKKQPARTPANRPPSGLSPEAVELWTGVVREFCLDDPAGLKLLQTACEALDWLRKAEAVVQADGLTVKDRYGALRGHPMLATMRDCRAALILSLHRLNLDIEPQKAIGRPPIPIGATLASIRGSR